MSATVVSETVVRGAEVGGGDDDGGAGDAPAVIVDAAELEARAADLAPLEECLAETHRGHAVAAPNEVTVAARATHLVAGIFGGVVGGMRGSPFGEGRGRF